jgi:membrane protease YdiL (CAAX protease family)
MSPAFPPPSSAPAGWYPDPSGVGERYFDGYDWVAHHPGFAEPEEHPSLPIGAALGALVVLVVSLLGGKTLVDWLLRYDWPVMIYVVILGVVGYGPSLAWGLYVRRKWGARRLTSLGWRFRWSDLGWGPLTWLAAVGTQLVLAAIVLVFDIPLSSNVDSAADLDTDRAYMVATLVTAVIAAPVIEELVFRGLVMRGLLSRMRPAFAIVAQGVLFGLAHVDPVRGVGNIGLAFVLSGVGVAFGTSAYLARRLGPTVIAHAIFNGVVMVIVLSGVLDDVDTELGALTAWLAGLPLG